MKRQKPSVPQQTSHKQRRSMRSALRQRWAKMISRCTRLEDSDFARWGGRGITVAEEWLGAGGFERFYSFVCNTLARPPGVTLEEIVFRGTNGTRYSLDRIDNDLGYSPENIRWATDQQQSDNQQRTAWTELDGERLPRPTAARKNGVHPKTAANRMRHGYVSHDAVTMPAGGRTARTRGWRDRVILEMIRAGDLVVDAQGFVFVRDRDGWHLPPVGTSSAGRYLGISISVPKRFNTCIPEEQRTGTRAYRSLFQHGRLVALFHHPLPMDDCYYEVDHINMNPRDDRPCNLRWRHPQDNRADAHRSRDRVGATPICYDDLAEQAAALASRAVEDAGMAAPVVPVDEPGLPANLPSAMVEELLEAMTTDPDFPRSIWADQRYRPILRGVLAASANNPRITEKRVTVECTSDKLNGVSRVFLMHLSTTSQVFHGCPQCNRQSFVKRTEVRNRVRYTSTKCESCNALDRARPGLAELIARNPRTGVKKDPSRITIGSSQRCHFRCRAKGCTNVVERKVKTLARLAEPPICEAHRRRGDNFDG